MTRTWSSASSVSSAACVFGYLVTLLSGATGVLLPRWKAEEALRLTEQHRCTYVLYMPTHGADILRAGRESQRDWLEPARPRARPASPTSAGSRCTRCSGCQPIADYGLSEVPGHVTHGLAEPCEKMIKTEGIPFPRDRGPDPRCTRRRRCPPGEVGAVVVNGPSRFLGLPRQRRAHAGVADRVGRATGPGDLGYIDADGHLIYGGRSKDIIRRGGVTLVPAEIEAALLRHPAIHEVAVVPLPDDRLGERACAAVVARAGSRRARV